MLQELELKKLVMTKILDVTIEVCDRNSRTSCIELQVHIRFNCVRRNTEKVVSIDLPLSIFVQLQVLSYQRRW